MDGSRTTATTWASSFIQSLSGLIFGPLIFIAAVIGLYYTEGALNYSKLCKNVPNFPTVQITPETDKHPLAAFSGKITLNGTLSDGKSLIPGKYLAYTRTTEVYAWDEKQTKIQKKDAQGNQIEETAVSYQLIWTSSPSSSTVFTHPEGHENPISEHQSADTKRQPTFKLGAYEVATDSLTLPNQEEPLRLSPDTVTIQPPALLTNNAIYTFHRPNGKPENPQPGDTRTTYSVLYADQKAATIFGKSDKNTIVVTLLSEIDGSNKTGAFQRLFFSTAREAIAQMADEYARQQLTSRIIIFFVMWIGVMMFLSPFAALFSFLPIIGELVSIAILFIGLLTAALSFTTAFILFNLMLAPLYVLGILGCLIGLLLYFLKRKATVLQH